jgi:ADP-ribosyl-[dinitrogen reductase] hydrolase
MSVGTLTGLAVGDALGMPFETRKPSDPKLVKWDGEYGSSEYHKLGPGQWTDDTQMSLALTRGMLKAGGYIPSAIADFYLEWFNDEPRGIGRNTKRAMQRLQKTRKWARSGEFGAEGNGTAMRIAPVGLRYSVPRTVAILARVDAGITHDSKEAREAAVGLAVAVSALADRLRKEEALQAALGQMEPSVVRDALEPGAPVSYDESKGPGAHVVESLPAAFRVFMATDSYEEAVVEAIRLGGDTDTVAAMVGALAGTYYGFEEIPEKYLDSLERAAEIRTLELDLARLRE